MIRRAFCVFVFLFGTGFRYERTVSPAAQGPNRLDVDVDLLAGSKSQLGDVRLFDSYGGEVSYLLVEPPSKDPQWITATVLPVTATKTTSGFEADLGTSREVDRLRVAGIPAPFLKPARLEGSGDRARWTLLGESTLFDLPDQELRLHEIAFPAGFFRYLRLTWDDRASARVRTTPNVSVRLYASGAPPEPLRFDVAFSKTGGEPGKSHYRITLPAASLPVEAIEVRVPSGNVFRQASVSEPRLTGAELLPVRLGAARLRRAERDGGVAADLAIPIAHPSGREILLIIDDANNPPLHIEAIVARTTPQPWIYFESADGQPLTARYGDDRVRAPRYDLEASRRFLGQTSLQRARWETAQRAAPETVQNTPPPIPLGAALDRRAFHISRPLTNPPAGLAVLALDADVVARSRELADVRIVDRAAHQVPYIVEHREEPLRLALTIPHRQEIRPSVSHYRFQLPYATLPRGTRIVIVTTARVFERNVSLWRTEDERTGRERERIATATWRHRDPETTAPPLILEGTLHGSRQVELEIEEGDNAPLPISSGEMLIPSYALRFYHPGTPLTLLYGNANTSAPRYDIALIASRIAIEPAHEMAIALPIAAPDAPPTTERKIFWLVIVVTAIVLAVLLRRLLASPGGEETRPLS